jgi:hypothetical protein
VSVLLDAGYAIADGDWKASLATLARRQLEASSRAEVLADLESLRVRARLAGREDIEDAILDVMDMITGWTGPNGKL